MSLPQGRTVDGWNLRLRSVEAPLQEVGSWLPTWVILLRALTPSGFHRRSASGRSRWLACGTGRVALDPKSLSVAFTHSLADVTALAQRPRP
jgi:hypothetical protein